MNLNGLLALTALLLHLAWIAWVLLGWVMTRGRPWLRWLHIGSLVYSILIETIGWPCPLTYAEQYFRRQAGGEPYQGDFLLHYLESLVYPDVPPELLTAVAVAVCLGLLGLYASRFLRRGTAVW